MAYRKMSKSAHNKSKENRRYTDQSVKNVSVQSLKIDFVLGFFLLIFTLAAYQPAWKGTPIWDDDGHITKPALRSVEGLTRIWTQLGATQQYYPLVHSVFWLEYHIWGDSTLGYHLVNILLHFLSTLLLVCIMRRLAIPGAWFIAAVFALHPVQVESVAWISELKNTLSGVFFLAAVLVYLKFDSERKRKFYVSAIGLFILGLMSKSVIATLPVSLLVVFWWKRGKLNRRQDIEPLIPFFVVGIASGFFTAWVEHTFIISGEEHKFNFSLIERCLIAGRAFWFYLGNIFWPAKLIFIYPRWNINQAVWWQYLFPVATLILAGVLLIFRRRSRAPLAVFLCFLATLFPTLGFFNVYPFRFSFVADHFQYLACIAPIALVVGSGSTYVLKKRSIRLALYMIVLLVFTVLTWKQSKMYANIETLYLTTIQKDPNCWMAYNNLGREKEINGRPDAAIAYYQKSMEINPNNTEPRINLGILLAKNGRINEAFACFHKALEINPRDDNAYNGLGNVYYQTGKTEEAIANFRKALEIDPNYSEAHYNIGNVLLQIGATEEALVHYNKAIEIDPNYCKAHNNIGNLLLQIGRTDEAIGHYKKAVECDPKFSEAQYNLGYALMQYGHSDEAIVHFKKALELNPNYTDAHNNLGNALFQIGHIDESIAHFQKALEIDSNNVITLHNLAFAFAQKGQFTDAIPILQRAILVAKSTSQQSLVSKISADLENLNQVNRSTPHVPR
jgi:tetratricopeptide (TPR) repeat protein